MKNYMTLLMVCGYLSVAAGNVAITKVSIDNKVNTGKHWVEGTISNTGAAFINSVTINWTIDNEIARTNKITGLNIAPGSSYNWTHSYGWKADNTGMHTFKVWISEINGSSEMEELQKTVEVFEAKKIGLVEIITSANCGPCAVHVPPLQERVAAANSFAITVEYHAGPGPYAGDPMYNDNIPLYSARMGYYNGSGYPTATINGAIGSYNWPPQITSQILFSQSQEISDLTIENLVFTIDSGMANFSADINSVNSSSSYPPSNKVQVVLIEKEVKFATPPGTNGEKEWINVAKEFYPTHFQGTFLRDVLNDGFINGSFDLSTLNIYDQSQLGIIIFIQNNSLTQPNGLREIYQTAFTDLRGEPDVSIPQATVIENYEATDELKIFPNPTRDIITIELPSFVEANGTTQLVLNNLLGQEVKAISLKNFKGKRLELTVNNLEDGIYIIQATIAGKKYSRRIEVIR